MNNKSLFATVLLALFSQSILAATPCDRDCLTKLTDATVEVLISGKTSGTLIGRSPKVTENGEPVAIDGTSLRKVTGLTYRHYFAEPVAGSAGFFGFTKESEGTSVFSLRIKAEGQSVSEIELLTTRKGDSAIYAPETMSAPKPEWDAELPATRRTSRDKMIAAANAYFDGLETGDGSKVPAAESCNRYENGGQTTHVSGMIAGGCKELSYFTYIKRVRDRRYTLVDEARGLIWGHVVFDIPGTTYQRTVNGKTRDVTIKPLSISLAELFKIEAGEIRDIEAVMRNVPFSARSGWN